MPGGSQTAAVDELALPPSLQDPGTECQSSWWSSQQPSVLGGTVQVPAVILHITWFPETSLREPVLDMLLALLSMGLRAETGLLQLGEHCRCPCLPGCGCGFTLIHQ